MTATRPLAWACTVFALLTAPAYAATGSDPAAAPYQCGFDPQSVVARFAANGDLAYEVRGLCGPNAFSGQVVVRPDGRFSEQFAVSGSNLRVRSMGQCSGDPLAMGALCTDPMVNVSDASGSWLMGYPPPLIRWAVQTSGANDSIWMRARQMAAKPLPPLPPVQPKALVRAGNRVVRAWWLAPDSGPDRPWVNFQIQGRPKGAQGAAWIPLGRSTQKDGMGYRADVGLMPLPNGYNWWEVRVCSETAFEVVCGAPLVPDSEARQIAVTTGVDAAASPDAATSPPPIVMTPARQKALADGIRRARNRQPPPPPPEAPR
jgi:hypothetical protein